MDDITIRAGTNRPVKLVFPNTFDTTGKTFELVIEWDGGRMIYTSDPALASSPDKAGPAPAITSTTEVTWTYTLADSRKFPQGRVAVAELQWTVGGVQDTDIGFLNVTRGVSND